VRVALVVPAWRPEEIFSARTAGTQINYWQPLGTLYVASALQASGHTVRFYNGAFLTHPEIMERLKGFSPGAVGIYSTTFGWDKAKAFATDARQIVPEAFIFVGGPYPVALGAQCLADAGAEALDAAVTGEGELTSVEALLRLCSGATLAGVKGLAWRERGEIRDNGPRELIMDLDALPFPARDLLDDAGSYVPPPATYRRWPVAVMTTSRGCNRHCLYCFQIDRTRSRGIRYRSVDDVLDEIELCLKQGYREIKFIDDTLAADYDRAMALAAGIKGRGLDFTWFASACVNQVDKPLLQAFKDAGCWAILFGAESGVQKNLNTIRKGIRLADTRAAVKAAQEVGLKVLTPFLIGIPGETYDEALETIRFACELNPDVANFHAITPFPGTDLYDRMAEFGSVSAELTDYTYQGIAFVPHTMTREQIAELRQLAFKRFYSRPSFLLRRLVQMRSMNDLRVAVNGMRSLFWIWVSKGLFKRGADGGRPRESWRG